MSAPTLSSPNSYPYPQYRPPAQTDSEQQLRSLLSLVEQYYQHYEQIVQQNKQILQDNGNVLDFISKINNKSQHDLNSIFETMKSMRKMLEEIFTKNMALLPQIYKEIAEAKGKVASMQEKIDDKELVIEGLKQSKQAVEKHLAQITMLYEKSRNDNMELNDKFNQKQQEFETESRQIRKTFLQVTESNEQQKRILQQMYESNQKLALTMNNLKQQKTQLELYIQKLSTELQKSTLKIQSLSSQLSKKEDRIKECESELESIHNSAKKVHKYSIGSNNNSSEQQENYGENRQSFADLADDKKIDKTKLNEQLHNYMIPTVKELNGSFIMGSGIKRSMGGDYESDYNSQYEDTNHNKPNVKSSIITENNFEESQLQPDAHAFAKNKDVTDPYFSHYILISQSVKIKQDCQDMLNIDMKPYYQEIIDKRIPMHLWDQWIKNRLRQLLRQNYSHQ